MTHRVTVLTKIDCPLCEQAKQVVARVGRDADLTLEVVDLATEAGRTLAMTTGPAFPPFVFVDGDPFSFGRLSERRLRRELHRRAAKSQR